MTAGSKIILPPSPELSILTICSEPSDNSTFLTGISLEAIEEAAAADPQSCPSRHISTLRPILSATASL